jgi:hypothetical protein
MVIGRSTGKMWSLPEFCSPKILKYNLMDFNGSDILFLVLVLSLVIMILNNGDWGGGRRARVPVNG